MATDFFDQFVTFDTTDPSALGGDVDLHENPPSPSILLDCLSDGLTSSSSNDQDTQSGKALSETSATSASLDIPLIPHSEEESLAQSKSVPPELTIPLAADPVLSGGSISDSELLRLEGISPKPAKPNATAPASTGSPSPRKHSRVLDSIYATWCRATHRSKPPKPQDHAKESSAGMAMTDAFKKEENGSFDFPINFDLNGFADIKLEETPCPVDFNGLPLSPPLTGRIPPDQQSSNISFVTGHLDDPFSDSVLAPPATIHRGTKNHDPGLDSPILTPALNDDIFFPMAYLSWTPTRTCFARHRNSPSNGAQARLNGRWKASLPTKLPTVLGLHPPLPARDPRTSTTCRVPVGGILRNTQIVTITTGIASTVVAIVEYAGMPPSICPCTISKPNCLTSTMPTRTSRGS